jgi:uncharacterized protein with LGFP repeats
VATWELWGGPDFQHLRKLGSAPRSGFETTVSAAVQSTDRVFQVHALDTSANLQGQSATTADAIQAKYAAFGGAASILGPPTGGEQPTAGGLEQDYAEGSIYWSPSTGAHEVHGSIWGHYKAFGGPSSPIGFPITDETGTPDGVGRYNHFQSGSIYWTPSTGPHEVQGAIHAKWAAAGWELGPLGYPTTDETTTADGIGRFNHFSKGGAIYWTPSTGAHEVHGAIYAEWVATGLERGPLGYPLTDETRTPDGIGRFNYFSKRGSIYWTPSTGPHEVQGAIFAYWASVGWERSRLGYPTSDEFTPFVGARQSNFQRGWIRWYTNGTIQTS